jgi:hypothetical protein
VPEVDGAVCYDTEDCYDVLAETCGAGEGLICPDELICSKEPDATTGMCLIVCESDKDCQYWGEPGCRDCVRIGDTGVVEAGGMFSYCDFISCK